MITLHDIGKANKYYYKPANAAINNAIEKNKIKDRDDYSYFWEYCNTSHIKGKWYDVFKHRHLSFTYMTVEIDDGGMLP